LPPCAFGGVTAPYVIDGAMDGRAFLAYVEQVLVPTFRFGKHRGERFDAVPIDYLEWIVSDQNS
jgi:hypothetical protein